VEQAEHVVDLGADFRLQDASLYPEWYGQEHVIQELLPRFSYGLPERYRSDITKLDHVAVPGCYPTAAALALAPLADAGLIQSTGVIVDAATGVSGAGRPAKPTNTFAAVDSDFSAYGLLNHRHTIEMEIVTGAQVLFTPHLAPMTRGILATCYARPTKVTSTQELLEMLAKSYAGEPFVFITEESPGTKATFGSNSVHITARYDKRTDTVLTIAALDNLIKGASGQAIQCANLLLGFDEGVGLSVVGIYP
ncbi:MAG: N-acetyl-gamma-glutamyl-phosphate reductase, partial [Acidimicrobiales bacterium]